MNKKIIILGIISLFALNNLYALYPRGGHGGSGTGGSHNGGGSHYSGGHQHGNRGEGYKHNSHGHGYNNYHHHSHRHNSYRYSSYRSRGYRDGRGWYGRGWGGWWGPYGYWGLGLTLVALPYYWALSDGYYFYNGGYYQRQGDIYIIVNPPVGTVVTQDFNQAKGDAKEDAKYEKNQISNGIAVKIEEEKYLLANGVYYQIVDQDKKTYKIVGTDSPWVDPQNPDRKYVKIEDNYYEKIVDEIDERKFTYKKAQKNLLLEEMEE